MLLSLPLTGLLLVASATSSAAASEFTHSPAVPSSNDAIVLRAGSAQLGWRVDASASFQALALHDDGTHGDRLAGDGEFAATLAPQPNGTQIELQLSGASAQRGVIRVDDALAASLPLPAGAQTSVHVLLSAADEALLQQHLDARRSTAVEASVIVARPGAVQIHHGARVALGSGKRTPDAQPLNIELPSGGTFDLRPRDPFAQTLGSALFRSAGLSAPAVAPVRVTLGAQAPRVFASIAPLGAEDTAVYSADRDAFGVPAKFEWSGEDARAYADSYVRTAGDGDDWSDLIALFDAVERAPSAQYYATVARVADLEQWARFFAVSSLLGHGDSLAAGVGNNFAVVFSGPGGRARLAPLNLDTLAQLQPNAAPVDPFAAAGVAGLERLFKNSKFRTQYVAALRDAETQILTAERIEPVLTQAARSASAVVVAQSPLRDAIVATPDLGVELKGSRTNAVVLDLPVVNDFPTTTDAELTLTGTADSFAVAQVLVNGMPAAWSPSTGTWSTGTEAAVWETIKPFASEWKYLDDNSDLDQDWIDPAFDDAAWPRDDAPMGYGNPSQGTLIDFGPDINNRYITTYFRGRINNIDPNLYQALDLRMQFDDGLAVYINGTEVARDNLEPKFSAAYELAEARVVGLLDYDTTTVRLRPELLVDGSNLVAAEVHQATLFSGDLWFDLELVGQTTENPQLVLNPGVNQVVVDYLDSSGKLIESETVDIYYETGSFTTYQGFNQGPITMTAAGGPYRLTNNTTFSGGLILEPGTTLFVDEAFILRVRLGELVSKGFREQRIWIGPTPGLAVTAPLIECDTGTYIDYTDYQGGGSMLATPGFSLSNFLIARNNYFTGRRDDLFVLFQTSVLFRNNIVGAQFGDPPVNPQPDREYFEGTGSIGDYFVIEENTFNLIAAKSDMIDTISGELPGPIMEVRGNTFLGSSDEIVDGNGDYLLDGNFVINVNNPDPNFSSNSNFISTEGTFRHYAITRNVIVNCQHIVNNVNNTFSYIENNTIYNIIVDPNSASSAVTMKLGSSIPGLGAYLTGNIWDTLPFFVFGQPDNGQPMFIEVHNDLVEDGAAFDNVLTHNVDFVVGDPEFVDVIANNFRLTPTSPGQASGPFGTDHGAFVPRAVQVLGPNGVLTVDTATLSVGGPGMFDFIYRLDGGPWSEPIEIQDPTDTMNESKRRIYDLELTGLSNGVHVVEFRGIDMASAFQPSVTTAPAFSVQVTGTVSLNEIFAPSRSAAGEVDEPGYVELINPGGTAFDLSGYALAGPDGVVQHRFPAGTALESVGLVTVPLALDPDGGELHLLDPQGTPVDAVTYGLQGNGTSLVKDLVAGTWHLGVPTPGATNSSAPNLGDPAALRISEWLAAGSDVEPFIELVNPTPFPIALADVTLTTALDGGSRVAFAPRSFLGAYEHRAVPATGRLRLDAAGGEIGLFVNGVTLPADAVFYGPQAPDVSMGQPSGAAPGQYELLDAPSPGAAQPSPDPLVSIEALVRPQASEPSNS